MSDRAHHRFADQSGFGLVEVLVTAVVVVVLATGVLAGLDAASQASGRTKARDIAATFAQDDQERMRTMPFGELSNLDQTRDEKSCDEDGGTCVTYRVRSRASWVSDKSGTEACLKGAVANVAYLKLVSTVTWTNIGRREPVVSESLLAPPTSGGQGTLAVRLAEADGVTPTEGITLTLTGPASQTAVTTGQGCAVFGGLPAGGGYTLSFGRAEYVGVNGERDIVDPVGVLAGSVSGRTYLYDHASTSTVSFVSTLGATTYSGQVADAVTLVQTQMSPPQRVFRAPDGIASPTITTDPLFPFQTGSPGGRYRVYAGDCGAEDPYQQSPSETRLTYLPDLNPGQPNQPATVPLPPLDTKITVNGRAPRSADGAKLRIVPTTPGCANPAWSAVASLPAITTAPAVGRPRLPSGQPAVGFPFGTYTVCAEALVAGQIRRQVFEDVALSSLDGTRVPAGGATPGVIDFTSTSGQPGSCDAAP